MTKLRSKATILFPSVALSGLLYLTLLCLQVAAEDAVFFTTEEKAWLDDHRGKVVLAPSPDWEPMENFDEHGRYTGLVADMIRLIEKKLDFKFKIIRVSSWEEILDKAMSREVDVISAAQITPERKQFMNWSQPYITLRTTIIVRNSLKGNLKLEQMQGMRIGVPSGYAVGEYIRANYPELLLIDVPTGWQGLLQVSFGELDGMIMEIPNALYEIEKHSITNLRLAGDTGYKLQLAIGIRKDWLIFTAIIDKALNNITKTERDEIFNRWIKLEPYRFYHNRTFWYVVAFISASVILITGTILIWNRTLKSQVLQRTEEIHLNEQRLEALLELSQRSDASIQEIIEFAFLKMVQLTQSHFGYLAFYDRQGFIYITDPEKDGTPISSALQPIAKGFEPKLKGLWGAAAETGKEIISNDYDYSNPKGLGVPKQFQDIVRYMNIPIFSGERVVAIAGMGNKTTDYDKSDLRQLTLLCQAMWRLIQKRRAEEALRKSERQFRDLVENSPNGISILRRGRLVYNNPRQVKLMTPLGSLDNPDYSRIYGEDLDKVKSFTESIKRGEPHPLEVDFRFRCKGEGDEKDILKWVKCMVSDINYQGRKAHLLNTMDITRAKELERLLIVQDKMASLGHVAAGIAHEIRNPLSGINIYLRVLKKHYNDPGKYEKIKKTIGEIRLASSKIEGVIKRVMDFSKPCEPRFAPIDINQPIRDALRLANTTHRKSGINISTELTEGLPLCLGETQLIEEVILNLINNSADAMKGQERPQKFHITTRLHDDLLIVTVEDNGPGIPQGGEEKIFEPFFTTKKHSTGIGLSICHRVITDHGGTLSAVSNENQGAKFTIELPVSGLHVS